jgi:hypothetical protein
MFVIVLGDGSTYDIASNCSILYVPSKYEGDEVEQFIKSDEGKNRMVEINLVFGGETEQFDGDLCFSVKMEKE